MEKKESAEAALTGGDRPAGRGGRAPGCRRAAPGRGVRRHHQGGGVQGLFARCRSPLSCRPTWSRSTTRSGWTRAGCRAVPVGPLRRLPHRAVRRRPGPGQGGPGRRGGALRGVPPDHDPDQRSRASDAGPRRGGRRLPGQPGPGRLRRGGPHPSDRRDPAGAVRVARRHHQQRRRVLRPDRGAEGGARAERHRGRRPDGLQAGGRADVRPLADQERRAAPARRRGRHAGEPLPAGRLRVDPAGPQQGRRRPGQPRHGRGRRHRAATPLEQPRGAASRRPARSRSRGRRRRWTTRPG